MGILNKISSYFRQLIRSIVCKMTKSEFYLEIHGDPLEKDKIVFITLSL